MAINENSVRERAHWLWRQAGEPEGRDLEFWFSAEQSLVQDGEPVDAEDYEIGSSPVPPPPFTTPGWTSQS